MELRNNHSAVLVLHDLIKDVLILTKRSEDLEHHPGEVSFPGGYWELGDADYSMTALRETYEELGIESHRIQIIKELPEEITLLGSQIHPWYATTKALEPMILNEDEVSKVLLIPWNLVIDLNSYEEVWVEKRGFRFKSWQFVHSDEFVWGATARIMRSLRGAV